MHPRPDWLYLSLGLTQPLDAREVRETRAAGRSYSAHGYELGFLTNAAAKWPPQALYLLLSLVTEDLKLKWGDRLAFGFRGTDAGELEPFTGYPEDLGFKPIGSIRAILFWPYLFPNANFATSTGKAMIWIATGITADEWDAAKGTTTAQLLLLLMRAGVGQRTDPDRPSVFADACWRDEWARIGPMGGEEAHRLLDEMIQE
jgi:hypothetical protein